MKPFRARNPVTIGVVAVLLLLAAMAASFNVKSLPLIGSGSTYSAYFSDSSGLTPDNEVRVAGVRVGEVEGITLAGSKVKVTFKVTESGVKLGDQTRAAIKIRTLLGQKFVDLMPAGGGKLQPRHPIPRSRTTSPFDVVQAFQGLAATTGKVNTTQLASAFNAISDTLTNTPASVRSSLRGLSRLSYTVSSRDAQLTQLLQRAKSVTGVLASRNAQLVKLIKDGNLLLGELNKRRKAIHTLLVSAQTLSKALIGLVVDNQKQLTPVLSKLSSAVSVLQKNQGNLDATITQLGKFAKVYTNVLGNGRWFDSYVACLIPPPVKIPVLNIQITDCDPDAQGGTA